MVGTRRRLLSALAVTGLVLVACFLVVLGVLLVAEHRGPFSAAEGVAVVEVEGLIVSADETVQALDRHREDPAIRAIVVRIESPGGVVAPTQEIYDAIHRVRAAGKPVVASLGSVAASGGYYLAAAAQHVVANPGSLTGSIGVIMQLANLEGLLKSVGIRYEVVKSGQFKDIGHLARAMSDAERAVLQELLDDMYEQFVSAVAQGRGLAREAVLPLADGRVFSGRRARELGLVDELGGLHQAIRAAATLGGISGEPRVVRPEPRWRLRDLLGWLGGLAQAGGTWTRPGVLPLPTLLGAAKVPLYLME